MCWRAMALGQNFNWGIQSIQINHMHKPLKVPHAIWVTFYQYLECH